jgi:photosystem II 13kDa protein
LLVDFDTASQVGRFFVAVFSLELRLNDIINNYLYLFVMAEMQFARGRTEPVVPDIRLTKSRNGQEGTAILYFNKPDALCGNDVDAVTGLYMIDEEGEIVTREVKAKFLDGQPAALEAIYLIKSAAEWDRFIRFMDRYAAEHGLGFDEAPKPKEENTET